MGTNIRTRQQAISRDANYPEYYRTKTAPDTTLTTFTDVKNLTGVREPLCNTSGSRGIFTGTSHYCVDTHATASVILSVEW